MLEPLNIYLKLQTKNVLFTYKSIQKRKCLNENSFKKNNKKIYMDALYVNEYKTIQY